MKKFLFIVFLFLCSLKLYSNDIYELTANLIIPNSNPKIELLEGTLFRISVISEKQIKMKINKIDSYIVDKTIVRMRLITKPDIFDTFPELPIINEEIYVPPPYLQVNDLLKILIKNNSFKDPELKKIIDSKEIQSYLEQTGEN